MNPDLTREWLSQKPSLVVKLGGDPESWNIVDVGDGNLNFVWVVTGRDLTLIVKKSPPFVRVLPEWSMSETRIQFECQALAEQAKWAPSFVPKIHAYDLSAALVVMDYLSPHIILRKGLMAAIKYPRLAEDMAEFLAQTLFHTSTLYLKNNEQREDAARYFTNSMIYVTEQLVFHEPFMTAKNNHWTDHPDLNAEVKAVQSDVALKLQAAFYHERFQNQSQALLHADLHTGSIMVTQDATAVIDPEFAFYGPIGFDVGAFIGNLFLSYFSQDGLATQDKEPLDRDDYKVWLLKTAEETWTLFASKFTKLWDTKHNGSLFIHFGKDAAPEDRKVAQAAYLYEVLTDTIAYAGLKMLRRIVGFAHVADLDTIVDEKVRVPCEVKALLFAKKLILNARNFKTI